MMRFLELRLGCQGIEEIQRIKEIADSSGSVSILLDGEIGDEIEVSITGPLLMDFIMAFSDRLKPKEG